MKYNKAYGFVYLTPVAVAVAVIYLMIIWNLVASFTIWEGMKATWKFAGLLNFTNLIQLRRFWVNVQNNFLWLVCFIVPTTLLGFVMAYMFHSLRRAEKVFRQIFLYPMALAFIVTGTLWAWVYDPGSGLLNSVLRLIGVNTTRLGWIALPNLAIYCMIVSAFWQYVGFALVIYMGAIRGLSDAMIEAANLDGAGHVRILFQVIFPNVGHGTLICTTMLAITTMKVFDLVWVMTGGGPGIRTEVLPYMMYRMTYDQRNIGMGAATSIVILILAAAMVIPYSRWAISKWMR
jgi:glucose/mannose transport system permease protein